VMSPGGDATMGAVGGVGRMASGSVSVAADQSLYDDGLVDFDGDLSDQNMLTNSGFATDTSDWSAGASTTIARTTLAAGVLHAEGGLAVTRTATTGTSTAVITPANGELIPTTNSRLFRMKQGHTYVATAYVKAAGTGRSVRFEMTAYSNSGSSMTLAGTAITSSSAGWNIIRHSWTAAVGYDTWLDVRVTWSGCLATEVHYLDSVAVWDKTAYTDLGWSFTNCDPHLVVAGSINLLYLVSTATSGQMIVMGPLSPYGERLAYESSMQIFGDTNADTFLSLLYFYNSNGTFASIDGGELNEVLSSSQWRRGSNFNTGGTGRSASHLVGTTPTLVRSRLEVPVTAITQWAYFYRMDLTSGGTVEGHLRPVGGIDDLRTGTYQLPATDIQTTDSTAFSPVTVIELSLASIVAASTPAAYLDPGRSYTVSFDLSAIQSSTNANIGSCYMRLQFSRDSGATYEEIDRSWWYPNDGAKEMWMVQKMNGSRLVPAGTSPHIKIDIYHDITAIGYTYYRGSQNGKTGKLTWLLLPA